jgi:hypothetical protein
VEVLREKKRKTGWNSGNHQNWLITVLRNWFTSSVM